MTEIQFALNQDDKVTLNLFGLDDSELTEETLRHRFALTEYRRYFLDDQSLQQACQAFKQLQQQAGDSADVQDQSKPDVSVVVAESREAVMTVEISDDRQMCLLVVETSFGAPNPDDDAIIAFLKEYGVVQGIKNGIVKALAGKLDNLPPGTVLKERVAEGRLPGETRQAAFEYRVVPIQDRLTKPALRDDGTVDMHDFGEIEMVTPGQVLIERIPPQVGESGFDVLGNIIHAEKPHDEPLKPGDGTELSPGNRNRLVATRAGVALRTDHGMEVVDTYSVRDVDLKTGNIQYDGSVMVQGSVREGMSVKAGGNVFVRDYVESATIEAGGNIIIGKGVLGRQLHEDKAEEHSNSAHIRCSGNLNVNYAQYADIDVGHKMVVNKHLIHCNVAADDISVVSPKKNDGKVLGGSLRPRFRLECNSLGAPSYAHMLVDFSSRVDEPMAALVKINEELGERVNVVRGMMAALRQFEAKPGCAETHEQIHKISNTITHFENLINELKGKRKELLDTVEEIRQSFEIVVQRKLFAGVVVRFISQENPVREERGPCRIRAKEKADTIAYFSL